MSKISETINLIKPFIEKIITSKIKEVLPPEMAEMIPGSVSDDSASVFSGATKGYDRIKDAVDNIQQPLWYSTYVYFNYMIIFLSLIYVSYTLYLVWSRGIDDEQTQKVKRTGEIVISNLFLILVVITFLALGSIVPSVIGFLKVIF